MYFLWQLETLLIDGSSRGKPARLNDFPLGKIVRESLTLQYPYGNTVFSESRQDLSIPAVIQGDADDIRFGENLAFIDSSEGIAECGLKNFIIGYSIHSGTPVFICDNHNYVLEAWQLVRKSQPTLIHIDQHRDDAPAAQIESLYHTRICDYIDFAIQNKWISDQVISIIEKNDLKQLNDMPDKNKICNIDLDVFAPECTILSLEDKVNAIIAAVDNCSLITLATSPGFIAQPRAIAVAKLLWQYL